MLVDIDIQEMEIIEVKWVQVRLSSGVSADLHRTGSDQIEPYGYYIPSTLNIPYLHHAI